MIDKETVEMGKIRNEFKWVNQVRSECQKLACASQGIKRVGEMFMMWANHKAHNSIDNDPCCRQITLIILFLKAYYG